MRRPASRFEGIVTPSFWLERMARATLPSRSEIGQALSDYGRTQFGGWPWPDAVQVRGRDPARFA